MNLEGYTSLQLQKWWYSICLALSKSISTNEICLAYKYLTEAYYELSYFFIPLDTHTKSDTATQNYQ